MPNPTPSTQAAFARILQQPPTAVAKLAGSEADSAITGSVRFYQTKFGVLVSAQVFGLPDRDAPCTQPVFAFHIHSGGACTGTPEDPFAAARTHYNPYNCPHPYHAGDLPPLFGNHGYAYMTVLTDRFTVREILGKTVILHRDPDDFTTQPSGNSGQKIACGVIAAYGRR